MCETRKIYISLVPLIIYLADFLENTPSERTPSRKNTYSWAFSYIQILVYLGRKFRFFNTTFWGPYCLNVTATPLLTEAASSNPAITLATETLNMQSSSFFWRSVAFSTEHSDLYESVCALAQHYCQGVCHRYISLSVKVQLVWPYVERFPATFGCGWVYPGAARLPFTIMLVAIV